MAIKSDHVLMNRVVAYQICRGNSMATLNGSSKVKVTNGTLLQEDNLKNGFCQLARCTSVASNDGVELLS